MNKKKYQAPKVENCRGILCCGHIQWESASFLADASGTVFEHSGLGPMLQYSKKPWLPVFFIWAI